LRRCPDDRENKLEKRGATPECGGTSNQARLELTWLQRGLMDHSERARQSANMTEREQEARLIRRLQVMISMVMSVISQDPNLTEEASELVAGAKRAALAMFPDKELAYDILYRPRLQRLMNERFRLQ
jgi:hypothetical protein